MIVLEKIHKILYTKFVKLSNNFKKSFLILELLVVGSI